VKKRFRSIALSVGLFLSLGMLSPAQAQDSEGGVRLSFVRDAEIENYLRVMASPIYRAAGIDPKSITLALVQSNTVNAFVAEGMNEFFYTGLLQLTDTPEQLAGVIAHETGHISGGHLIRGKEEMKNASAEVLLGTLLAIAAGAASGNADVVAGGIIGGSQMAMRSYLSFSRAQEASADAAALKFLDSSGFSARGMVEFFEKLSGQELLPQSRQDEYVRTHPLTQDRIDAVRRHWETSPFRDVKMPEKFSVMHERMKAKLLGFLQPETALLRFAEKDPRISARYARAIALYRTGKTDKALAMVDGLIKAEPDNPFFFELKGQIQFENGRIEDSLVNYRKATEMLPDSALLRQAYGHALLEAKDQEKNGTRLDLAIQNLLEANRLEGRVPMTWRFLAGAWGRKAAVTKDPAFEAMATYALAEEAAAKGKDKVARQLAKRAMKGLPKGSTYWLRAQDIKLSTEPDDKREDRDEPRRRSEEYR